MNRYIPDDTQAGSLRDFYYILFRHSRKVFIVFGAITVCVLLFTLLQPEMYRSDAKLLMRIGRESVTLDPTATTGQTIAIAQDRKNEINTGVEILRSRELAEKVVDSLTPVIILNEPIETLAEKFLEESKIRNTSLQTQQNVHPVMALPEGIHGNTDFTDALKLRDRAVLALMQNLNVQVEKSSDIISVSYEAQSAKVARDVVDKLIGYYLDKHIAIYRPQGSHQFFEDQTSKMLADIAASEDSLRRAKNETGIASLNEQRSILIERIGNLYRGIEENKANIASSRDKVRSLETSLDDLPDMVPVEKVIGNEYMRNDLYRLQLKEQELLSKFSEDMNQVQEIRRQIKEAQLHLQDNPQVNLGLNSNRQRMQLELMTEKATLSSLISRGKELQDLLVDAKNELQSINNSELLITSLERNLEIKENIFRKYSDNLEQARIDEALQVQKISNISIAQEPTVPMKPVRPRKMRNIALGLFMGVLGGVGFAFFAEYFDHSIKSQDDVERKLGLKTFITIPERMRKRA